MKINVGDRVVCYGETDGKFFDGETGVVRYVGRGEIYDVVGVEFDEDIDGHDLGFTLGWPNRVRAGHGWVVRSETVSVITSQEPPDMPISYDDVLGKEANNSEI